MYLYNVCVQVPRHSSGLTSSTSTGIMELITANTRQANMLKHLHRNITKAPFFTIFSKCSRCWGLGATMQIARRPRTTVNVLLIIGCTWSALSNHEMLQDILQWLSYSKIEANLKTKGLSRSNNFLRTQWYSLLNSQATNGVWQCRPALQTVQALSQGCGEAAPSAKQPDCSDNRLSQSPWLHKSSLYKSWAVVGQLLSFCIAWEKIGWAGLRSKRNTNNQRKEKRTQNADSEGKSNPFQYRWFRD